MKKVIVMILSIVLVLVSLVPVYAISSSPGALNISRYSKPVDLKLAIATSPATKFIPNDSFTSNTWTRSWKKDMNINVKIIWQAVNNGAGSPYEMKLNLAIASNNLPDVVVLSNYSQFDRLQKADKLEDLTSYYSEYTSDFIKTNIMADGGEALSWGKVNGKLYGIPSKGVQYQTNRMVYIRHDWFVESGLAAPKTLEDVIKIAAAFKSKDPSNRFGIALGKKVIEDGFADITGISNSMGAYPGIWVDNGKGELVYGSTQPNMKKSLQVLSDLFNQKLIDPAFATLDGGALAQQVADSKVGIYFSNCWLPDWPLNDLYRTSGGKADWDIYPLLPSKDFTGHLYAQVQDPQAQLAVVRKGYKNPEVLFKIMNYTEARLDMPKTAQLSKFYADPKFPGINIFQYNPIYIMWKDPMSNFNTQKNVTNAIDKKDTSFVTLPQDKMMYDSVSRFLNDKAAGKVPNDMDWAWSKYWYGDNSTYGVQNLYWKNNNYLVNKLVGFQTPSMVTSWTTLKQQEIAEFAQIISGIKPVSDFDNFVKKFNDQGGDVITYEVNQWYASKK